MSKPGFAPMRRCWCRKRCDIKMSPTPTCRQHRIPGRSSKPRDFRAIATASLSRRRHCRARSAIEVSRFSTQAGSRGRFDPRRPTNSAAHAAHGCISLWCATSKRAYPFVFRPRLVRSFVPFAQLIYCRDIGDFVRFAGPIGRALARHGRPLVLIDANGPIPGLLGWFGRGNMPKYFKGPQRPRLGDLAYTEYAVLGV